MVYFYTLKSMLVIYLIFKENKTANSQFNEQYSLSFYFILGVFFLHFKFKAVWVICFSILQLSYCGKTATKLI